MDGTDTIVVSVPARPEFLQVLRTVAAAVVARLDFRVDEIEDLKIAVDETASQLLRAAPASTLTLRVMVGASDLEAVVASDAPPEGRWPPEGYERSLTWQVLTALTDETVYLEDGTTSVRFVKRRT